MSSQPEEEGSVPQLCATPLTSVPYSTPSPLIKEWGLERKRDLLGKGKRGMRV